MRDEFLSGADDDVDRDVLEAPRAPLEDLEAAAGAPLPGFGPFVQEWRRLLQTGELAVWDGLVDDWEREVVMRLDGVAGLEALACQTRRPSHLRAWCQQVRAAGDWAAYLQACERAEGLLPNDCGWRAAFLDEAALAAQVLGRDDVGGRLRAAWFAGRGFSRLLRWLATDADAPTMRRHAAEALACVPAEDGRQRGLCLVLLGQYQEAAPLLSDAPGLGWSSSEHPGHVLFAALAKVLGGQSSARPNGAWLDSWVRPSDEHEPRLRTVEAGELLAMAELNAPDDEDRRVMLDALRIAATKRAEGITDKKRRRHYGHVARLAVAYAEVAPDGGAWLAGFRQTYRRYSALQREFRH